MGLIRNAVKVDLSNTEISQIPSEVFNYRNLHKLFLSHNKIQVIQKEISNLIRLRLLDLSNNKINVLYARLFNLGKLETLILNNNKIKTLPPQIARLERLRKLSISSNNIKSLPKELMKLTNLEFLNISNNPIHEFPLEILHLKQLKHLRIANINLTTFPFESILKELPNLKYLYCYSSHINQIRTQETNRDYLFLSSYKGNCIQKLKELVELSAHPQSEISVKEAEEKVSEKKYKNISKPETKKNQRIRTTTGSEPIGTDNRNTIFICYSHRDDRWRKKVEIAIKTMELEGIQVKLWSDKKIKTGFRWQDSIFSILSRTRIAILLVSNDFLASEFIKDKELPRILKKAKSDELAVMSIILSYCRFTENKELSLYQSLNPPDTPMAKLLKYKQDLYLLKLTNDIEHYINKPVTMQMI